MGSLACQWLNSEQADTLINWQWDELDARHRLLEQILSGYEFMAHPCGFHAWLHLPEPWRASDLIEQAAQRGVTLISPEPFCVGSQPAPQTIRICLTPPPQRDTLQQGLERISELLAEGPRPSVPLV